MSEARAGRVAAGSANATASVRRSEPRSTAVAAGTMNTWSGSMRT